MHFTGTIWRPPYEAESLLLEVTAGCTHHKCKFCTLYHDLPFRFRLSPLRDIEADLQEAQLYAADPIAKLSARLQGLPKPDSVKRVFLVGANPFVLHFRRLKEIAELIRRYLPACESIGCFARVTDVGLKTDGELSELRELGFDGLSIGVESGSDAALAFMNKGYLSGEIIRQTARLDRAGIAYCFMYLAGLAGAVQGGCAGERRGFQPDPSPADWLLYAHRLPGIGAVPGNSGRKLAGGRRAGEAGGGADPH